MIAYLYPLITLIVLILLYLQHHHKGMSILSVIHSGATLLITCILILNPDSWADEAPFFHLDHLSLLMMAITGIIFTCASLYAVGYISGLVQAGELHRRSLRIFYIGFSLLLLATIMAFASPDLARFWIFAELTTLLSALLVAILAVRDKIDASLKYIFVCSTSMLFSFIGVIFFFELMRMTTGTGTLNWEEILMQAEHFDPGMLTIACIFFFVGFAAKSGISPMHTWLPEAHAKAPSAVSAVLSGAILNVGMYGILRMTGVIHHTGIFREISLLFLVFGVLTMFIACFSMLKEKGSKKIIAFSSVENMGFMLFATGIGTPFAVFWTLFHMLGHSLVKAGLFFAAGIFHRQYLSHKPEEEDRIGDLFRLQPFAAVSCILGYLALIGVPLFPLFLSKFGILIEAGKISLLLPLTALILFTVAAVALFRFLIGILGEVFEKDTLPEPYYAPLWMRLPIIILLIITIILGIIMVPGEEKFLLAAVKDIGIMGGL